MPHILHVTLLTSLALSSLPFPSCLKWCDVTGSALGPSPFKLFITDIIIIITLLTYFSSHPWERSPQWQGLNGLWYLVWNLVPGSSPNPLTGSPTHPGVQASGRCL